MSARLSIGRTLAVAGLVTAVAVPLTAGSAFADTKPHHPPAPAQSASHPAMPGQHAGHPAMPGHNAGHPAMPGHNAGHPAMPGHSAGHPAMPGHSMNHHPMPTRHHSGVTTLRTRVRNAQVRMSPTTDRHGRTLSVLRAPGSRVAVTCWTLGAREKGSNTWYRTVAPSRGYISSTEVVRPAHPVGRCR